MLDWRYYFTFCSFIFKLSVTTTAATPTYERLTLSILRSVCWTINEYYILRHKNRISAIILTPLFSNFFPRIIQITYLSRLDTTLIITNPSYSLRHNIRQTSITVFYCIVDFRHSFYLRSFFNSTFTCLNTIDVRLTAVLQGI